MRKACARPECQPEPYLQLKEGDRAMLELGSNDAVGLQSKAIAIERDRSFQVINTERNDRYTGVHGWYLQKHGSERCIAWLKHCPH
jgi:hypothetical protein